MELNRKFLIKLARQLTRDRNDNSLARLHFHAGANKRYYEIPLVSVQRSTIRHFVCSTNLASSVVMAVRVRLFLCLLSFLLVAQARKLVKMNFCGVFSVIKAWSVVVHRKNTWIALCVGVSVYAVVVA